MGESPRCRGEEKGDEADAGAPGCLVESATTFKGAHEHTNSVNRSYSDLDTMWFVTYAVILCWMRTALQQPLNLALARKQTSHTASNMTTWQIIRLVYCSEGGLRGLMQGAMALTLGCALSEAVYLWLFEYSRESLPLPNKATRDAVSGYVADSACRLLYLPLSIVALRQMTVNCEGMQNHKMAVSTSVFRTLVAMYREGGLRTLYAGYGTTLVFGCQWTAMWWAMYGSSKGCLYAAADGFLLDDAKHGAVADHGPYFSWPSWKHWLLAKDDNVVLNTTASVLTSVATAVLFNPYLVVRANLQVTPNARLLGVVRDVFRTRGLLGFYGGLSLNIGTCLIDGVLASTSYEYAKLWADRSHRGS
uniref:Putative mitochondrial carrier protein n=1 Tax=Trypanosoma congolense (strain IL3000) TaxID=1068625 RepID=G0US37_TRYCI|nr:putative mitochondrial carrier protein [Trypanosoma congolense IL3000]